MSKSTYRVFSAHGGPQPILSSPTTEWLPRPHVHEAQAPPTLPLQGSCCSTSSGVRPRTARCSPSGAGWSTWRTSAAGPAASPAPHPPWLWSRPGECSCSSAGLPWDLGSGFMGGVSAASRSRGSSLVTLQLATTIIVCCVGVSERQRDIEHFTATVPGCCC